VDRPAPESPLGDHRIGDGNVACLRVTHRQVKDGFVGPLMRLVTRGGIGRVRWRSEASRKSGKAQLIENMPDDRRALDDCDDFHRPTALRTMVRKFFSGYEKS